MKHSVSIIGLGYVGLTTAICFASRGINVTGIDIDEQKIRNLKKGNAEFYEKNAQKMLQKVIKNGKLKVSDNFDAVKNTEMSFLAVNTPSRKNGSMASKFILAATKNIAKIIKEKKEYHLVIVKSTVIPNTTLKTVIPTLEKITQKKCGKDFGVVVNPEFLREGNAIYDTLHPNKIVMGSDSKKDLRKLKKLYIDFYKKLPKTVETNYSNAELIKYVNNSFLATKISFMNFVSRISEKIEGGDVEIIKKAITLDKRISPLFLNAGLGYGGSCFPKDLEAFRQFCIKEGINPRLIEDTIEINNSQPLTVVKLIKRRFKKLDGKNISILGLAFKPETDDIRNAVSITIIKELLKNGAKIKAYDPKANNNMKKYFGKKITISDTSTSCIKGTDCCIIVTEWEEFRNIQPEKYIHLMRNPMLIDGRRLYNAEKYSKKIEYHAIGVSYFN